jgi:hypothetical protein
MEGEKRDLFAPARILSAPGSDYVRDMFDTHILLWKET